MSKIWSNLVSDVDLDDPEVGSEVRAGEVVVQNPAAGLDAPHCQLMPKEWPMQLGAEGLKAILRQRHVLYGSPDDRKGKSPRNPQG